MIHKLALGTVQFGLNYGINNHLGQVPPQKVEEILSICQDYGMDTLDTAHAYGTSEQVLGLCNLRKFQIISKLPNIEVNQVATVFEESLANLKRQQIYGYLVHSFAIYQQEPAIWEKLQQLRAKGRVQKIGFSLYHTEELTFLLDNHVDFDIVQLPYNILDQRFEPYFSILKEKEIEIHIRSVFLQGLFFKSIPHLPKHFKSIVPKLIQLNKFKEKHHLSTVKTCLGFVLQNPNIDKVVFGVDTPQQLLDNLTTVQEVTQSLVQINWSQLNVLQEDDLQIIHPAFWKI